MIKITNNNLVKNNSFKILNQYLYSLYINQLVKYLKMNVKKNLMNSY